MNRRQKTILKLRTALADLVSAGENMKAAGFSDLAEQVEVIRQRVAAVRGKLIALEEQERKCPDCSTSLFGKVTVAGFCGPCWAAKG